MPNIYPAEIPSRAAEEVQNDFVTLRFLVAPTDMDSLGETVQAGRVMEWIDKAGYVCAVGWSGSYSVTAYVGDVHFRSPISPGSIVQAHARIIHTGRTSMHVFVSIETADTRNREFTNATHCILVFVAVDEDGRPRPVPSWHPWGDAAKTLQCGRLHESSHANGSSKQCCRSDTRMPAQLREQSFVFWPAPATRTGAATRTEES